MATKLQKLRNSGPFQNGFTPLPIPATTLRKKANGTYSRDLKDDPKDTDYRRRYIR